MDKQEHIQGDGRAEIYEVGFHIVPIVSVDALPAEVTAIRSLIESNGGAVIAEDAPKTRSLAYTLSRMVAGKKEKFDTAHFGWIKFEMPASSISAVKEGLDKTSNILRYLIIKTVRENTMASQIKVQKADEKKPAEDAKPTPKMSEEDMDKTIDELVKE